MNIHGLQKMTLLDYPGHVACTVFLGGCDFRCPFCHNFELVDGSFAPIMDSEELLTFLKKRVELLDGVAITGGEPCLHPELPDLMAAIKALGYAVKLDTNGYHPAMLRTIMERQLVDYVAMDVKNSPAKYAVTCGVEKLDLAPIYESISLLMRGDVDYEFRTTAVQEFHEEKDFEEIGPCIQGARRYYIQCFTDRESVPFGNLHAPTLEQLESFVQISRKYVPQTELRGVK